MSNLAQALMGGQAVAEQAGLQEAVGRSRIAQAMAQAQKDAAGAALDGEKLDNLQRRPAMMEEQAALMSGADLPLVRAIRQSITTGKAPQQELAGPTPDGEPLTGDMQIDPAKRSAVAQALSRLMPLQTNTGDFKADDWAQALGNFRTQDLGDRVISGDLKPGQVGAAQAAVAGKPLFNSDATGAVLDLFGGALDTANPMAQASIGVKREAAGAQKANAAQSYASADNSRASAAKTRAEMADGTNNRGGKAPVGYRWGADGQTLEHIPGGPADPTTKGAKLQRPPTEGQAKAIGFGSRMAVSDEILSDLAKDGVTRPGIIKGVAETTGTVLGLGTDSMGGALSDIAGKATNWTQSERQQQVEQAQRDFVNALLRRESGAAIGLGEFRNAEKQYFPQPNDDPATLRQKASNRRVAINAMKSEFGEAYLPEFTRTVEEARASRQSKAAPKAGGASGSWGAEPAAPAAGGRNITVNW